MSAHVCSLPRTYSCIIEIVRKFQEVPDPNLLAWKLYLLNLKSVDRRYSMKEKAPERYRELMGRLPSLRYEPQPSLTDAQRVAAALCWAYQSGEGEGRKDPLFESVLSYAEVLAHSIAEEVAEEVGMTYHPKDASSILFRWLHLHKELENTWEE